MNQYHGLMPTLYPGALATAPTWLVSIDAMWLSFQTMATNRTAAISGENKFSLPPLAGLPLQPHSSNRSPSGSAAPTSRSRPVGSSRNPVEMNVAHADHCDSDPFSQNYNHRPTEPSDWETVLHVSESFQNNYPRSWTPLIAPEERAQAWRDSKGRC